MLIFCHPFYNSFDIANVEQHEFNRQALNKNAGEKGLHFSFVGELRPKHFSI